MGGRAGLPPPPSDALDDEELQEEDLRARYPRYDQGVINALSRLDHNAINYELVVQVMCRSPQSRLLRQGVSLPSSAAAGDLSFSPSVCIQQAHDWICEADCCVERRVDSPVGAALWRTAGRSGLGTTPAWYSF